jgi:hypothetical protein
MTQEEILREIRRTAADNGGSPLGVRRFEQETGIRQADWFGVHWRSWGDAVRAAGFQANALTQGVGDEQLLERYAQLARELGRAPTKGDLRLAKLRDPTLPSDLAFTRRFGGYPGLRSRAQDWCAARRDFEEVAQLLGRAVGGTHPAAQTPRIDTALGFVYLIKHGSRSEYKIGRTSNPIRREGEMRLQLPERVKPVHYIETDDPAGVETYWHTRFATKRKEGEWFALSPDDVRAFKKWKRIS